jgi:hypothetical protein
MAPALLVALTTSCVPQGGHNKRHVFDNMFIEEALLGVLRVVVVFAFGAASCELGVVENGDNEQ